MVIFTGLSVRTAPENLLFLKAISGELEPTKGSVVLGPGERLSVLSRITLSGMNIQSWIRL